jgi:hypothetical protein
MAVAQRAAEKPRSVVRLRDAERFSDDLGGFGLVVGPATVARCDKDDAADWCVRRYLVARSIRGELRFPTTVKAYSRSVPRFILEGPGDELLGVEVGIADSGALQYRPDEKDAEGDIVRLYPRGGMSEEPGRSLVESLSSVVSQAGRTIASVDRGVIPPCDLIVFVAAADQLRDDDETSLARMKNAPFPVQPFRQIHVLSGDTIVLDILAARARVRLAGNYDHDFQQWLRRQATLARLGDAAQLDLAHLAEELESLAGKDRRAIYSHIRNILHHLLKWEFQKARRSKSWLRSLTNARNEIDAIIEDSPSLGADALLNEALVKEYDRARRLALVDTKLSETALPSQCPFSVEQVLDKAYPAPDALKKD